MIEWIFSAHQHVSKISVEYQACHVEIAGAVLGHCDFE